MSHVERPHLKHVLHTVSVLEAVVLRSFGPDGGQVLFTRDTGQVMLSRSGTRILTALRLEHPLARMVVECVWKHTAVTGDGSKNFILLLASLLRVIHTAACKRCNVSHTYSSREAMENATARHLADTLLAFGLEELGDVISTGVVPYGGVLSWEDPSAHAVPAHTNKDMHTLQKLLTAFFHTRLGHTYCDFFSRLTCEFLSCWKCEDKAPSYLLHLIDDNFSVLHTPVSGFPVSCSRVIEGQVIHRDFSTPFSWTNNQPVKAVVFSGHLHPDAHKAGAVLELRGGERGVLRYTSCTERSLECVITTLQSLGVSLLLCAVKQSEAVLALAGLSGMCVVECVGEDERSLFAQLSGAVPVSDCWLIEQEHVATLTFCRPILLGAHRYIHMSFHDSEIKPHSLVICGAGEGQTDQCACAFQDALRMLHTTWEPMHTTATTAAKSILHSGKSRSPSSKPPLQKNVLNPGCVVPVGGTFEFLLHHALLQHGHAHLDSDPHAPFHTDTGIPALSRLLADALLCVPQQIYSHSPRRYLQTQTLVTNYMQNRRHPFSPMCEHNHRSPQSNNALEDSELRVGHCRKVDFKSDVFTLDSGVESVSCKYKLILAVLQCLSSLLRLDAVLHTHTPLHKQACRHSSSSLEDTEEGDED
ncbi:BBSome complex assembly protein BBS10 [Myripristis murdjan]|uniref:BBSome complex assembly protein BBS10 n=1 Tax=Myripristis murdjan TaxID=586833 RepID=UPI001175F03B|nr:Bardet-Biedl syndrome 10 protein [Myripristis murdjan]XP_029909436.1 Bardet-Biedl syndrome 10 protein [Myripristis murdjan]XP_029909437.1 Bardet-Biedl syndrome 10 protein [Myripristis murdjan]XP_029909438.1 Bardet-Biedl syndrome 10 protein [Myripristis murdjan]